MVPFPIQIDSSESYKEAVMESETATVGDFSFFGADRLIIKPGSETFIPCFPSLTDLQSNQMLVSHSNRMDLHKNSVIPIHPAQFSREIYDMGSTQYTNMPFSVNLNTPGAKTGVPTHRSVPVSVDGGCPTQDSLHSPGDNGEAISHFWSNSASDEAEEQQVIDVRKHRRMLSNRESARRSRLRKQQHLDELRAQLDHLKAENEQILEKFNITSQHYAHITEENCLLRSHGLELSHKLQRLQHTLNAQSHADFETMGVETRNCSAAHMSSAYSTIAHSVFPNLWF
jgi:hypothetical protein